MPLLDGTFTYSIGIHSKGGVLFDWREPAGTFEVMNPGKATGFIDAARGALVATVPMDDPAAAEPPRWTLRTRSRDAWRTAA